jgi:3-oxoacyl-[acyl-carrier-protein] synthase-3
MVRPKIVGIGSFAPAKVLTNSDLEKMVDTSDEWIISRTGISERRIATDSEDNSDMCVEAAQGAFRMAGMTATDIDLILAGTVTPDFRLPSLACMIQKKLGAFNAASMDVVAACAGFIHGLSVAEAYIKAGMYKRILVFGSEKLSSITNYEDRNTCVLFGDAAGAAIIAESDDDSGILATYLKSDGRLDNLLYIPDGGTHAPCSHTNGDRSHRTNTCIRMSGNEVFKHAVRHMGDAAARVVREAGLTSDDIDLFVPHQANIRIIRATAERLKLPWEKVFLNIEKYGNTSAASVPLALDQAIQEGRIKKGDNIVTVAFGGGLTWGAAAIRW